MGLAVFEGANTGQKHHQKQKSAGALSRFARRDLGLRGEVTFHQQKPLANTVPGMGCGGGLSAPAPHSWEGVKRPALLYTSPAKRILIERMPLSAGG